MWETEESSQNSFSSDSLNLQLVLIRTAVQTHAYTYSLVLSALQRAYKRNKQPCNVAVPSHWQWALECRTRGRGVGKHSVHVCVCMCEPSCQISQMISNTESWQQEEGTISVIYPLFFFCSCSLFPLFFFFFLCFLLLVIDRPPTASHFVFLGLYLFFKDVLPVMSKYLSKWNKWITKKKKKKRCRHISYRSAVMLQEKELG